MCVARWSLGQRKRQRRKTSAFNTATAEAELFSYYPHLHLAGDSSLEFHRNIVDTEGFQ